MYKVTLNFKFIIKKTFSWMCRVVAISSLFVPYNIFAEFIGIIICDFLNRIFNIKIGNNFWYLLFSILVLFLFIFVVISFLVVFKKRYKLFKLGNNHYLYVQYGNIFAKKIIEKRYGSKNIIISFNRCFDVVVDDNLISSESLHGVLIKYLENEGLAENTINELIHNRLREKGILPEEILVGDKKKGNRQKYPIGTIAEINSENSNVFLLLGLSKFNGVEKKGTPNNEYMHAIIKLFEYCEKNSQGHPIYMPIIGAGLSRTKKQERDILEFLVKYIKLNKEKYCFDINIVVEEGRKETISIFGLN